jgi:predicted SAM-dependent methyltransferase
MFARVAFRAYRPSGLSAAGLPSRLANNARFMSQKAVAGSKGRTMPAHNYRTTTPVSENMEATFTIRVCRIFEIPCALLHTIWEI